MQTKTHLERTRQPEIRLRSQAITKTLDQNLKCKKKLLEHCILMLLYALKYIRYYDSFPNAANTLTCKKKQQLIFSDYHKIHAYSLKVVLRVCPILLLGFTLRDTKIKV